ncbi:ATP-binding protein [Paenochrobactrum glaciei]|uniref:histidine kinase n=1 Tax=Paenochrobactrum glaciei TaxID=486407 RepID=A0ABP3REL0_9HYPH
MTKNGLLWKVVLAMTIVNLVALATMFFGWIVFITFYEWLFPKTPYPEDWTPFDLVVLAMIILVGELTAAIVGWRLVKKIAAPLAAVGAAARLVAEGNFATRAKLDEKIFGEAEQLLSDFNDMTVRLEAAEAELRYSNMAIAHELRTPLTILRGRLQGLNDGVYKADPALYASLISHVDGLTKLVEDLRMLGLFSSSKLELTSTKIDLGAEAEAVLHSFAPDLAAAGIDVETDLRPIMVCADEARIRQALLAILENACRYASGAPLKVETVVIDDHAVLRVCDRGRGLTDEGYERAFERFWREDNSRARARGGSGLGLSVVRVIAESHGGAATIAKRDGGGTVVSLMLPLRAPDTKPVLPA